MFLDNAVKEQIAGLRTELADVSNWSFVGTSKVFNHPNDETISWNQDFLSPYGIYPPKSLKRPAPAKSRRPAHGSSDQELVPVVQSNNNKKQPILTNSTRPSNRLSSSSSSSQQLAASSSSSSVICLHTHDTRSEGPHPTVVGESRICRQRVSCEPNRYESVPLHSGEFARQSTHPLRKRREIPAVDNPCLCQGVRCNFCSLGAKGLFFCGLSRTAMSQWC